MGRGWPSGLLLPVLFTLLFSACHEAGDRRQAADPNAEASSSITIEDADGREVTLPKPAERVISLIPSATATLRAIGAVDALVARTDFDTTTWAEALPSVGGGLQPSIEAIVAARPDLVIRFGGTQDPETPARLDDLGIPHLAVRPDRVEDVLAIARLLGRVTGKDEEGAALAARLRDELDEVKASARNAAPVHVAYVLGGDPPWVAGPDTYITQLIELSGGINVFDDLERLYTSVSPEELLARDVDLILIPRGTTFDRRLARGRPVAALDPELEIPGPSVARAAREIAEALRRHRP